MVGNTTGLTRWLDSSWFSVISVFCFVFVDIVGSLVIGNRVCLTTVVVIIVARTTCVVLGLIFVSFELLVLISVMTWLFALVTSQFGFFWILLCGLLPHSNHLQFIWSLQTNQFQLLSRCETICSYVSFSELARVFELFRWGGTLAYTNCSMIA